MKQAFLSILETMSHYWPVALALGLVGITVPAIFLRRFFASARTPDERCQTAVQHSLKRLHSQDYFVAEMLYIPRLTGNGTTHLQHIVLSRFGIFVIQAQQQKGLIRGGLTDRDWLCVSQQETSPFPNPIMRNQYHVRSLARFLELPEALFFSIVVFSNEVTFESQPPENVITSALGRRILSQRAELLSSDVLTHARAKIQLHLQNMDHEEAERDHATAQRHWVRDGEANRVFSTESPSIT